MRVTTIFVIVFIILGSESRGHFCPRGQNKPFCLCNETSDDINLICRINDINELCILSCGRYVPYLKQLSIFLNGIKTLPSSHLAYGNLHSLIITGHDLAAIQDGAFENLEKNLELLQVNNTNLREIPTAAIINLANLYTLNLTGNKISAIKESLRSLPLRYLYLSHNRISTIERGTFSSMLEILDLSNNRLSSLNGSFTGHLLSLRQLDISKNSIVRLTSELTEVHTLAYLAADSNSIVTIEDGSLSTFYQLESLSLAYNRIYRIVDGLKGLESLVNLDLSYNGLTIIHELAFSDLIMLEKLSLSGNNIKYLAERLLNCLSFLEELDISHNSLKELNFLLSSPSAVNLNSARIDMDYLHEQDTKTCPVRNYTTLITLRITGNEIRCVSKVKEILNDLHSKDVDIDGNPCWIRG